MVSTPKARRTYSRVVGRPWIVQGPNRFSDRFYIEGGKTMIRRIILALACAGAIGAVYLTPKANAQQAFNQQWGQSYSTQDWNRLYHYPYVYYPQNFWGPDYYRSSGNMYYRYPPEMQIPVYNRQWHNEYPQDRRYYGGHHFNLDVF